ncbi:MAG: Phenylacetic acid catabolic protein [Rhodospirillales bacterium]
MATRLTSDPQEMERAELALQHRVKAGYKLEDESEMTPRYREVLVNTMHIAADLEMMTLPVYHPALLVGPCLDDKIAVAAAIQDELGHAQVMYRMLEDFGYDTHRMIFDRDPKEFRTFFLIEHPLKSYIECVVAMLLGDRAGYTTTRDLEEHCSFGPYARSLRKVNFEEQWHVGHGERWVKFFWNHSPETRKRVQEAVDFYFPMAVMWFGVPDGMKKRTDQLAYKIRGASNDEMRQRWLTEVVPFCEEVGIRVPAHFDKEKNAYVLDYQPPILLDQETRTWDYTTVSWEEKFKQWKEGGREKLPALARMQSEVWGEELW